MKVSLEQYARAVLSLGLSEKALVTFQENLLAFSAVLKSDTRARNFLLSPKSSLDQKEAWLTGIMEKECARFLLLVLKNGDGKKLSAIAQRIEALHDTANGVARVEVTTSAPLSDAHEKKLHAEFESRLKKKVRLVPRVDASIIGGIAIKIGDAVTDASIQSRLEVFKKSFTHN